MSAASSAATSPASRTASAAMRPARRLWIAQSRFHIPRDDHSDGFFPRDDVAHRTLGVQLIAVVRIVFAVDAGLKVDRLACRLIALREIGDSARISALQLAVFIGVV